MAAQRQRRTRTNPAVAAANEPQDSATSWEYVVIDSQDNEEVAFDSPGDARTYQRRSLNGEGRIERRKKS